MAASHRQLDCAQCRGDLFGCYGGSSFLSGCYGGGSNRDCYGTCAAVCASDVAYNYLLSKATFDTISGQYTRSGWSTRYAKPCIVLKWCYSYNSGTSGIRTCLDGAASRQYTGTQRYNSSMGSNTYNDHAEKNGTYYKEFVFCSKLETYNSQSDWPAISIAYFPLP